MNEQLNIILNGNNVKGNKGETILQLAKRLGIEIPTLCNDPRLEPYSSCYVCVVEVAGMRGLQPSCSTRLTEGMTITTENDKIRTARKTALDLLLSNHYADCAAPCKQTCPAGVDVQGYISFVEKGLYHEAVALIKETNPFPAVCGRVCVRPCELACRRNLLDEGTAVGIDYMKRFAADFDLNSKSKYVPDIKKPTGKKVAIIGAGPGGLSSAFFLRKEGHTVDVFEAAPKGGGWLRYGIPEYRLPNDVLQKEIDNITELGVNIYYNKRLGENILYKEIKDNYDAMILAIGCQTGTRIGCEGDDALNVFSGIDFLKQMELSGKKHDFSGKTVGVIGGGNTAMDCCRTAIRCGAKKVYVIYRRTEAEMPANPIEIHESKLEGVEYLFLTAPIKVNKNEKDELKSIVCIKMDLGEPDASGRRRPIPIENSEFDIEMDFALAAIGQKTTINFLDDINSYANGTLKGNKWGDIDANRKTLQTGVDSIFAAGDGVTGAATLIEAIAQAKIASRSCHQFLSGLPIEAPKQEFLSKKDNFRKQTPAEYIGKFENQKREEMPTLDPKARMNFDEVELGYANEIVAKLEASRCMECGCSEFFTCDLKKYATEYEVEQKRFEGEYQEYSVDFRHPYIEIDNNKCILCARCVRICKEVVSANALGLINRGFNTYVAPSMGNSLQETECESCGLCISACPTGAITENVNFKPGPVKTSKVETVCNYCSVGCEIIIHHRGNFVMKVTGKKGALINKDGNICRFPKFGYSYLNDSSRLNKPLLKKNGKFVEISFSEAYEIIVDKIKSVNADENAFYAGARLSNEELYLIQKMARYAVGTNNVNSFLYLERGKGYFDSSRANVPFEQISGASKIYLFGSEINNDNAVVGFMVNNTRVTKNVPIEIVTTKSENSMTHKVDKVHNIKSYYHLVKAMNHFLLANGLENAMFINDNCDDFDTYKKTLLTENFDELFKKSGYSNIKEFENFVKDYNNQMNGILIFSDKEISGKTTQELFNLAMITGKLGKTSNGLISLKEKNNSQGIFDMGICSKMGVGGQIMNDNTYLEKLKIAWKTDSLPKLIKAGHIDMLDEGKIKNMFVFGEDPIGCAIDKKRISGWFSNAKFVVVQDYFMTETAQKADLILPASLPLETDGSFTNTQRMIQEVYKQFTSKVDRLNYQQIHDLIECFGDNEYETINDVLLEAISLIPIKSENQKFTFNITEKDNSKRMFNFGCDSLVEKFEEEFKNKFEN
ncbi:MAG TPA: hypothetical protein DDX39_04020 [Bacteroidales bacterium]|nr:MAG: hypothetical protein A2W98_09180 [Bacteroidetes bacterium GWF2_33_38]OFY89608.1 MAG: hypothetical protein A2236_04005 [Bacteroidetes bacterium RIFOXYA2_FULL_33_7]HBF87788.1 hypothetical protein [Bacteroidales bacterium]